MITIFIKHILIVILILQTLQLVAANNKSTLDLYTNINKLYTNFLTCRKNNMLSWLLVLLS